MNASDAHAAATIAIVAAAGLQDLAPAIERGVPTRDLARTVSHAVSLGILRLGQTQPQLKSPSLRGG